MTETFFEFVGKIVLYGIGAVGIAYGLFVFLGKKWIENKFATKLEEYKSVQNKELEDFRYKINILFSKATKIHEKEFEILPEAWIKLQNALGLISRLVSPFQSYPDLNRMVEDELQEFVAKSRLTETQRKRVLNESDKNEYYMDIIFWHDLYEVQSGISDFHNYIMRNKIFLSADLKEKFQQIDDIIWEAFTMSKISKEGEDRKMRHDAYKKIKDDTNIIRDEIEKLVQKRLHYKED